MSVDTALEDLVRRAVREEVRAALRETQAPPAPAEDAWLTVREAAKLVGMHPSTLRAAAERGALHVEGPRRARRVLRSELTRWMASRPAAAAGDVDDTPARRALELVRRAR